MKTAIKLILIYLGIQLICGGLIGIPFTIIARIYGKHTIYPKTRQVGHSFHFHF